MKHIDPREHVLFEMESARRLAAFQDFFPFTAVIAGLLLLTLVFAGVLQQDPRPAPGQMGSASDVPAHALRT